MSSSESDPTSDLAPCGMSRRAFCAAAGAGLVTVGLVACTPAGEMMGGNSDLGDQPDLTTGQAGGCAPGGVNAGLASDIAMGAAKHVTDNNNYDLFVCRDAGGLYALSASCTHSGCTVQKQATRFYCPCHRATFDLNGLHPTSPARTALPHFALCLDDGGNAIVDYNTTVAATTRL